MTQRWEGSISLNEGATASAVASVSVFNGDSYIVRLNVPAIGLVLDCAYTGTKFLYESTDNTYLVSVSALDNTPAEKNYTFSVSFSSPAQDEYNVVWEVTAGDAILVQPTLTAI